MVKKFVTSQAVVDDHKLLVNSISKKSCEKNNLHSSGKVLKPKVYILKDSSTFKNLVQELTGNGNIGCTSVTDTSASFSSSCATTFKPVEHEQVPYIQNNIMYTCEDYGFQDFSPDMPLHSYDHHVGLISMSVEYPPCTIIPRPLDHEQIPAIGNSTMYSFKDYGFQESSPELSFDSPGHHVDVISTPVTSDFSQEIIDNMPTTLISEDREFQSTWDMMSFPLQYEEMEPWFLEMDSSVHNNYSSQWLQPLMPAEVCAFDCDFFAIM